MEAIYGDLGASGIECEEKIGRRCGVAVCGKI